MPPPTLTPGVFAVRRRVSSYDVGPDHRLTVPGLLRQLHDTAQAHAAGLGFGYRSLGARGLAWALVCLDLGFRDSAPLGEGGFDAATAVYRSSGPLVLRDYRATDTEGRVFATGQSMWALIDLETRRTAKPDPELQATLARIATDAINDRRARRLPAAEQSGDPELATAVALHECDFNGHLNNVAAVQRMLDALYVRLVDSAPPRAPALALREVRLSPKRLRVSYHAEALFRERVHCALSHQDGGSYLARLYGQAGRPVASASVEL